MSTEVQNSKEMNIWKCFSMNIGSSSNCWSKSQLSYCF